MMCLEIACPIQRRSSSRLKRISKDNFYQKYIASFGVFLQTLLLARCLYFCFLHCLFVKQESIECILISENQDF